MPGETWLAAAEIRHLAPGGTLTFNPDTLGLPAIRFPRPGRAIWYCMALLDPRTTITLTMTRTAMTLYGPVVMLTDAARAQPVALSLDRRGKAEPPAETPSIKRAEFQSPLLTAFWGHPITLRAGVVLPPGLRHGPKAPLSNRLPHPRLRRRLHRSLAGRSGVS